MKNTDDVLDEVLGVLDPVENELGIEKMLTPTISRPSKDKEDVDADYEYQRENFYNLIEKVRTQSKVYLMLQKNLTTLEVMK